MRLDLRGPREIKQYADYALEIGDLPDLDGAEVRATLRRRYGEPEPVAFSVEILEIERPARVRIRLSRAQTGALAPSLYAWDLAARFSGLDQVARLREGLAVVRIGSTDFGSMPPPPPDGSEGWLSTFQQPFSWGDASPKPIIQVPAGRTVATAQLIIQVPFNGNGPLLSLGDAQNPQRLIGLARNNPALVAEFEENPGYTYLTTTQILLFIIPGVGNTQGQGLILLNF